MLCRDSYVSLLWGGWVGRETTPSSLSSLGAALPPLLLLFILCQPWPQIHHFSKKLHDSREPASVLCVQSARRTARLVGRDDGAALQSVTIHPSKGKERDVMDSAYIPERKGPIYEFWLQKSNDLPAP